MGYRVQLTYRAEQELDNILDYLTNHLFNFQAARRFMNSFEEGMQQLSLFPELGEVVRNRYFSVLSVHKKRLREWDRTSNFKFVVSLLQG